MRRVLSRQTFRETFAAAVFKSLGLDNEEEETRILMEDAQDMASDSGLLLQALQQRTAALGSAASQAAMAAAMEEEAKTAVGQAVPGERERGLAGQTGSPVTATTQARTTLREGT